MKKRKMALGHGQQCGDWREDSIKGLNVVEKVQ